MNFQRIMNAGVHDIVNRGWQELWRSVDRLAVTTSAESPDNFRLFGHLAPQPIFGQLGTKVCREEREEVARTARQQFLRTARERFFEGAANIDTATFVETHMPEICDRVIMSADSVCEGRFRLLGHRALYLDEHIDWHKNPVSDHRVPKVHWSRINPLDENTVGDAKVLWELNRHQWMVDLGQAYCFSGDERYTRRFLAYIKEWMAANRPGVGINWASSLEVSFRLISWCWALVLFRNSRKFTAGTYAEIISWIATHAAHIEKYPSHYFSPNTHLTGEALGLVYAGTLFPELPKAEHWLNTGTRILMNQLQKQVYPDGVYFEQSTCYQRYTIDIYLHFLILARRNGIEVPSYVEERIQKMLDFLMAVSGPDGKLPQIGDNDGGRLLPLIQRDPEDVRDLFAIGAVLFHRSDYAWAARGAAPEMLWLLGSSAWREFTELKAAPPDRPASVRFPDGGYTIMRSDWSDQAHQLIFDVGPLGCHFSGGHGHADLLSIQCSAFGKAQLVDPGTYCYTAHANWRNYFRSTGAHSTVVIDGKSQATATGPFSWHKRPRARLRRWVTSREFDLADAEHDAYQYLSDPVMHRRRVYFAKPHYWVVVDDLSGADVHDIDLRFQFGATHVTLGEDDWVSSWNDDGRGLLIRPFCAIPLKREIHSGNIEPIEGWISSDYGLRQPAPVLNYSATTLFPMRIATLLLPSDGADVQPPVVTSITAGDGMFLLFEKEKTSIRIDENSIEISDSGNDAR